VRRFLYLSPFFPPMTRVGALRPLKFARHLPAFGWAPVVLCDLRAGDSVDRRLGEAVPNSTIVVRDYSRQTIPASDRATSPTQPSPVASPRPRTPAQRRADKPGRRRLSAEDINPLGAHAFGIAHALRAARACLRAHPSCEAIVVNADPYAAMIVGTKLAAETGLPLIHDLRDPWSCCELRRGLRPAIQRAVVDRVERRAVEAAAAVILNTETALRDYRRHYSDLDPGRFTCIRNHADAALIAAARPESKSTPVAAPFTPFAVLFMGNFRRFVEGAAILEALALLRAEGLGADQLRLVITGAVPEALWAQAEALGVADMIGDHPFVPYVEVGPLMARAQLLLSFSHPTAQRIPAKIYDYLASDRPLLVIAENPELRDLLERAGGASVHPHADVQGIAATIAAAHADHARALELDPALSTRPAADRAVRGSRRALGLDSITASGALAQLLDDACGATHTIPRGGPRPPAPEPTHG